MEPSARRVAYHYLRAASVLQLADDAKTQLDAVGAWVADLRSQAALMERLIAKGEARRLGRTGAIRIKSVNYDGNRIMAKVQGTTDDYTTWITLKPRPGHHCTCPDWQRNGKNVGPCKHVLKLGEYWRDERLGPALSALDDSLVSILERSEI